jgi:hypothetical protein
MVSQLAFSYPYTNLVLKVEGIGWLEAWGMSLIDTMETLQALAASEWRRRKRRRAERWNPLRRRMHEITKATDAEERPTYRLAESDG